VTRSDIFARPFGILRIIEGIPVELEGKSGAILDSLDSGDAFLAGDAYGKLSVL
jgi:hypothetical protein